MIFDWLVQTTEDFVKIRRSSMRLWMGLLSLMERIKNEVSMLYFNSYRLAVGFDNRVGHDYLHDTDV